MILVAFFLLGSISSVMGDDKIECSNSTIIAKSRTRRYLVFYETTKIMVRIYYRFKPYINKINSPFSLDFCLKTLFHGVEEYLPMVLDFVAT